MKVLSHAKKTLLAVICLTMFSACAQLPTSGSVNAVTQRISNTGAIGISAQGPAKDASAEEIVQGFLRACAAGYSDGFQVARSFLGTATAKSWIPEKQVTVFMAGSTPSVKQEADGSVKVQVAAAGSLDESGLYVNAEARSQVSSNFSLARSQDGQWRIVSLADGVFLSTSAFQTTYASTKLFFYTIDQKEFVPVQRWYPRGKQSTYLVRALLEGPPKDLKNLVTTAFPPGATLAQTGVEIASGLASVHLTLPPTHVDQHNIDLMYRQLNRIMSEIAGVAKVEISNEQGRIYATNEIMAPLTPAADLYLFKQGAIVSRSAGRDNLARSTSELATLNVSALARNYDGSLFALRDDNRRLMSFIGERLNTLYVGKNLVAPSIDRHNWIWTGDEAFPTSVLAINATGSLLSYGLPLPVDARISLLKASSDGVRLAVVYNTPDGAVIAIYGIRRDGNGNPVGIEELSKVASLATHPRSLTWIAGSSLAVLGAVGEKTEITVYQLDGPSKILNALPAASSISAWENESSLIILTANGEVYERSGANWRKETDQVVSANYPG